MALSKATQDAITAAVTLALTQALASTPARGKAASPVATVERVATCACGAEYKRGRRVDEIAASPIGLCGLKGYTAHKL